MKKNKNRYTGSQCNTSDHKQWNRRSFLQAMGLAGGAAMTLGGKSLAASKQTRLTNALSEVEQDRILVIIKLNGGNDGLNTIVPIYDYDTYRNARPSLGFRENELINLNDEFAIADYATSFEKLWGEGQMKVIHGIGYRNNNSLSHFAGSDIVSTGTPDTSVGSGWIGRYYEDRYPDFLFNPPEKPAAITIGGSTLPFTDGDINYSFGVGSPERLQSIAGTGLLYDLNDTTDDCLYGDQVRFLKSVTNNTFSYAGVISEAYSKSSDFPGYPDNDLASQLAIISRLIKGGLGTKIYYVSLSGFDTHRSQAGTHEDLITRLGDSVAAFYNDLKNSGWDDKVLTMTVSEFGRRVAQNGSGGTAHGNGSCTMLYGPALEGNGFVGEHPSLSDRNLIPNIDFRQMYASILRDWFCVDEQTIKATTLLGGEFSYIDLGFKCEQDAVVEIEEEEEEVEEVILVTEELENEEVVTQEEIENGEVVTEEEVVAQEEVDREEVVTEEEVVTQEEVDSEEVVTEEEVVTQEEVENEEVAVEEEVVTQVEVENEEAIVTITNDEVAIVEEEQLVERFTFGVSYEGDQTLLKIENDVTAHIDITLFDMTGKRISSLRNGILFEGSQTINVKSATNDNLNPGMYICRVYKSGKRYTKKLLLN